MHRSFSVVTPAMVIDDALLRTARSVIAQSGVDLQYIVVTPKGQPPADWPSELVQRTRFVGVPDATESFLLREGLEQASGEFVGWLKPGDVYYRDTLSVVSEVFVAQPEAGVVFGDAVLFDELHKPQGRFRTRDAHAGLLSRRCCFCQPATFVRRTAFQQVGSLDASFTHWADYDLWLRLHASGVPFVRTPELLAGCPIPSDRRQLRFGPFRRDLSLSAAEEQNRLLQRHFGEVPAHALLHTGRVAALQEWFVGRRKRWKLLVALRHASAAGRRWNDSPQLPWLASLALPFARPPREWRRLHRDRHRFAAVESLKARAADPAQTTAARRAELARQRQAGELGWLGWLAGSARILADAALLKAYMFGKKVEENYKLAKSYGKRRLFKLGNYPARPLTVPTTYHAPIKIAGASPVISIVTPNLNQGHHLEATIRSVLDQNYEALELIVQDGGSTDGSLDVIRRYSDRLARWTTEPDKGQANAINLGMRHARGEILAYLNSDDILLPGSLAYVAKYFVEHPEVDVVYGHRVLIDERGDDVGRWVLPPHDNHTLGFVDYIPQETMFWRRRIWDQVGGGLDEAFHFAMDWDLILRFREAGARFARLPRFLGAFRISDDNKTSTQLETIGRRDIEILRKRVLGHLPSDREIKRKTRGYMQRHWLWDKLYLAGVLRY
ncbi:MAG: glycosyltransferase [Planctomycetaceae bacterium]